LGVSLPHRSPEPIDMGEVRRVAQRAEALGFRDLWVTENTLDHAFCFDPIVVLTYAAAVTTKIRLGASVVVLAIHSPLMVAHQWACLDYVSNGRAILGVGLGREHHYRQFAVPEEGRVRRFREEVDLIKALWTEDKVTYRGAFYHLENETMAPKPVQKPRPPIWMGVGHPDALRRTARLADGWMGSGGSSKAAFAQSVPVLKEALAAQGRDPNDFPISKRCFCRCMRRRMKRAGNCCAGLPRCTAIRRGSTPAASTARPSRSPSSSRSWPPRVPIIYC